jgi:hypothetical protein
MRYLPQLRILKVRLTGCTGAVLAFVILIESRKSGGRLNCKRLTAFYANSN